jgi:hypothetical protein
MIPKNGYRLSEKIMLPAIKTVVSRGSAVSELRLPYLQSAWASA